MKKKHEEVTHEMLLNHLVDEEGMYGVLRILSKIAMARSSKSRYVQAAKAWAHASDVAHAAAKEVEV